MKLVPLLLASVVISDAAVTLGGTADYYTRTADFLPTTAYTMMMWWKPATTTGDHGIFENGGATLFVASADSTLRIYFNSNVSTGTVAPVGTWHNIAWTVDGTAHKVYLNGTVILDTTFGGSHDAERFFIGGDHWGDWGKGDFAGAKFWSRALSAAELTTERTQQHPVNVTGIYASYLFTDTTTDFVDASPNMRNLDDSGVPTDATGPPVPIGTYGGGGTPAPVYPSAILNNPLVTMLRRSLP